MDNNMEVEIRPYNTSGLLRPSNYSGIYNMLPPFDIDMDWSKVPLVMNMSNMPYTGLLKVLPSWEIGVKIFLYVFSIVLSIIGNVIVIFIVYKNKLMRTTTNYYLVNLAIADLMVALSCSWVHLVHDLTEGWALGAFFCKFNSFAQVLSSVSSILTLTLISCDRFFGIVFAMKAHLTERRARTCLIIVWICATAVACPLLKYRMQFMTHWSNHTEVWCDDNWPRVLSVDSGTGMMRVLQPHRVIYYTLITVVLFFLPIIVMSIAYSFIIWRLWSKRYPGERIESGTLAQNKVKRKVVIMLVVLLVVFVICWLPFQATILYSEFRSTTNQSLPSWFPTFQFVSTYMAYSNSAVNPIIYAGFNENFKRGFLILIGVRKSHGKRGSVSWRRDSSMRTTILVTKI